MHILPATLVNLSNYSHYYGKLIWKASREVWEAQRIPL
jgi:hypothetical protein